MIALPTTRNRLLTTLMPPLTLHLPDSLGLDAQEVTMLVATRLYEQGKLSLGQAAELAGLSKRAFMEVLGDYGVALFNYPPEDLARDVANAGIYSGGGRPCAG